MKYLHSCNILHRDLKPSNLLVNSNCFLKVSFLKFSFKNSNLFIFQICDFGLARLWDENDCRGLCLTPEVVTEYYRPPELLMGVSKYSAAADVWSIGCIFAELLGRRVLFFGKGPMDQVSNLFFYRKHNSFVNNFRF
jgi:serine/threonine protein kinase